MAKKKIKQSSESQNTKILMIKMNKTMFQDQVEEKDLFYHLLMLEVADLWISCTSTEWLFVVKSDFLICSLPLHVIQDGQKF